jgi:hypothetical protein
MRRVCLARNEAGKRVLRFPGVDLFRSCPTHDDEGFARKLVGDVVMCCGAETLRGIDRQITRRGKGVRKVINNFLRVPRS